MLAYILVKKGQKYVITYFTYPNQEVQYKDLTV